MNWEQLKTIFWLRWRLMCHQWRGAGALGAALAVLLLLLALSVAAGAFAGGLAAGYFALADASPRTILFTWLGITLAFLFIWLAGLMAELQRSEAIDLQKLMHLPVALGQMFFINYLVSHFSLGTILAVPAMIGLGLGLMLGRSGQMILVIPLALSMVFMVTAWTYYLRGWLAKLMSNPRRRRTIIVGITMVFVLLAQGPNLYFNVLHHFGRRHGDDQEKVVEMKRTLDTLVAVQGLVPPLWVSLGASRLAEGNPLPALLGMLGCAALGALGLRRAYVATVSFYRGKSGGQAPLRAAVAGVPKAPAAPRTTGKNLFLEKNLPLAPEQAAAVALATLRSMLRAPEVKMAWGSSFIATLVLGGLYLLRGGENVSAPAKPFLATVSVAMPAFFLAQFFINQFGFDRDGFRALILSPVERRLVLLGKNLAAAPVGLLLGGILLAITSARLHLPPLGILATLFQLFSVLLMGLVIGNLFSIIAPYRIQPGSMKPTKMPGLASLLLIACHFLFPLAMVPVFIGPLVELFWHRLELPDFVPVNLIFSTGYLVVMGLVYWSTLGPLGRLLYRRETKILAIIAVEVE